MKRRSWLAIGTKSLFVLVLVLVPLGVCGGGSYPYGEFGKYGDNEAHNLLNAPPVILLHGIKGAKLVTVNDEKTVWGNTGLNGLFSDYERLALYPDPGRLPNNMPWDDQQYYLAIDPLQTIKPEKLLTSFLVGWDVFPVFEFELYGHLVDFLKDEPIELEVGKRLFLFAYDWRLDNRVAAILLANSLSNYEKGYLEFQARRQLNVKDSEQSEETTKRVQQCVAEAKKDPTNKPSSTRERQSCRARWNMLKASGALDREGNVRFTIVTHSMGGLLGRYFADGLGYKNRVHKLILFGSPNQGGMDAIRAVLVGEHPPSVLHYVGINWFSAAKTRKIHLSFGSVFQLFPRYRDAVVDLQTGDDLTDQYGLREGDITPATIAKWKELLSLLNVELDKYNGVLDRYLEFQLTSARCFHLAIIGGAEPCGDEGTRIKQIINYLQRYYPSVKALPPKGVSREPPIINFGGQCDRTLASMAVGGTKVIFLDHAPTEGIEGSFFSFGGGGSKIYLVGDNRVPVKSLDYPHKAKEGDASFLVCKNHVGIIKDESLLYNLLRAIFY